MAASLSSKHIPTLLGVIVLLAGLVGGIFLANSATTGFLPRASAETTPKNPKITNISDTSFTVSWTTDIKTTGYIKYGTSPSSLTLTVTDDRDQTSGSVGSFRTHQVTLRGLKASTPYYFKIGSSSNLLYDDNGKPYQTSTTTPVTSTAKTIYGQVLSGQQTGLSGALVYISGDALSPISALTQSSGSFVVSLSQARTKDLQQAAQLNDSTVLSVLVVSPENDSTSIITTTLALSQPLPDIVIGVNQDLTTSAAPVQSTAAPSEQVQSKFTSQLLAPPTETSTASAQPLFITSPTENESLSKSRPTFSGTSAKSVKISLTLAGPSLFTVSTTANSSGKWSYTPTKSLDTGSYTLSAIATTSGQTQSDTVNFSVTLPTPKPTASGSSQLTSTSSSSPSALPSSGTMGFSLLLFAAGVLFIGAGTTFVLAKNENDSVPS